MEVKYRIIETDPSQHSIVVRYYTDKLSELDLAISYYNDQNGNPVLQTRPDGSPARCQTDYNINIWKTPTPSAEEIKELAAASAPFDWFQLKHDILDPSVNTSMESVSSIMEQEFVAVKPVPVVVVANTSSNSSANTAPLSDEQINDIINSIVNQPTSNT